MQFRVIDEPTVRFARSQDHSDHALLLSPWPESLLALRTNLGAADRHGGQRSRLRQLGCSGLLC